MIDFIQWRFYELPNGAYHFDPDSEEASEICISGDTAIDPIKVGQRPAITVTRSHAVFQGTGLGDQEYVDMRTGAKSQLDLIPLTVMVNCLSRIDIEAESLAGHVTREIRAYRDAIVKSMVGLVDIGSKIGMSPPSPAGALVSGSTDTEWTAVVLSLPTYVSHAIHTLPLNKPIFQGFRTKINTPSAG